ncbi:hypothetical protein [Eupransor demetentiae]|uniref:SemiSWEET family n=1 Tax=Eupransor demetentiae TaxID=3109584 RepID=A0ABM9N348_9LACO|nr:SemiSWEET family [Lactobacillaceae bacterium LMG 33000]
MKYRVDNHVDENERREVSPERIKFLKTMSKVATISCILMYVFYVFQIRQNLSGNPVSPTQPAMAMVNATLWTIYGWTKTYRDWPIVISNVPGVLFGLVTLVTIYIH